MLSFETLTREALPRLAPYFAENPYRICDLTVGGVFLWRNVYSTEYAVREGHLFTRLYDKNGLIHYNLPLGPDVRGALTLLLSELPRPVRFCTVPAEALSLFGEGVAVTPHRELFDYLYEKESFVSLAGKRYAGQRNHVNRFTRLFGAGVIEPITRDNVAEVRAFFATLPPPEGESAVAEAAVVAGLLDAPDFFGMTGGLLRADGRVVGFSFGEVVGDTLYAHVEKADRTCPGAYQTLASRLAAVAGGEARYVNREDDAGDEGLRTAKLALHPVALIEKNTVALF